MYSLAPLRGDHPTSGSLVIYPITEHISGLLPGIEAISMAEYIPSSSHETDSSPPINMIFRASDRFSPRDHLYYYVLDPNEGSTTANLAYTSAPHKALTGSIAR